MTDKEIIKALECCSTASCISNKCHYEKLHDIPTCTTKLTRDALDLINRQQAVIERLNNNISAMARTLSNSAKETRAEAIKEFWSRLQGIAYQSGDWSHGEHPMVVELDDAEEIYEEMVGEDK